MKEHGSGGSLQLVLAGARRSCSVRDQTVVGIRPPLRLSWTVTSLNE